MKSGYAGKDTLNGGKGNDVMEGGEGDDVYIWNPGDGNDILCDREGANVLQIGPGVKPDSVEVLRSGNDIVFVLNEDGERITVRNWYAEERYRLSEIRFSDGTIWTEADVEKMRPVFRGTAGDDAVVGSPGNDDLYGLEGADRLYGNAGDDLLVGGTGDDAVFGGSGDDTYIWNPGDGNDTLSDNMGRNVLKFGEGVAPSGLVLSLEDNDLVIAVGETGEKVRILDWGGSKKA